MTEKMKKKYWIGVVGSVQVADNFEADPWWCFPRNAKKGDMIFMYCTGKASIEKQGIFALCELKNNPRTEHKNNRRCTEFGSWMISGRIRLAYVELEFIKRFKAHLITKEMKKDSMLSEVGCVRRNFQGTVFEITENVFDRMRKILDKKNK